MSERASAECTNKFIKKCWRTLTDNHCGYLMDKLLLKSVSGLQD